jgi:hypothetical protein
MMHGLPRSALILAGAVLLLVALDAGASPWNVPVDYQLDGDMPLGLSFPPLSDDRDRELLAEHLPALGVEITRFDAPWALREPARDEYSWAPMDTRMAFIAEQGLVPVVTFPADGPEWIRQGISTDKQNERSAAFTAEANQEFATFVTDFVVRYAERHPGLIDFVQFGNEWVSDYWYAGSAAEFRATLETFAAAARAADPNLTILLGGFSVGQAASLAAVDGTVDEFWDSDGSTVTAGMVVAMLDQQQADLDAGLIEETFISRVETVLASDAYDWLDVHLYDQPELWDEYYQAVDGLDLAFALHFRLVQSGSALHHRSGLMKRRIIGIRELPAYYVFGRINNPEHAWPVAE